MGCAASCTRAASTAGATRSGVCSRARFIEVRRCWRRTADLLDSGHGRRECSCGLRLGPLLCCELGDTAGGGGGVRAVEADDSGELRRRRLRPAGYRRLDGHSRSSSHERDGGLDLDRRQGASELGRTEQGTSLVQ